MKIFNKVVPPLLDLIWENKNDNIYWTLFVRKHIYELEWGPIKESYLRILSWRPGGPYL